MNYIFDAKKLTLPGAFQDIASARRALTGYIDEGGMLVEEGVFMKIFKPASQGGRGDEIFEVIYNSDNALKNDLDLDPDDLQAARDLFFSYVSDPNSILYSFIKVE